MLVLLFFGAKRLPEVARALGQAANEFKKAKDETFENDKMNLQQPVTPTTTQPNLLETREVVRQSIQTETTSVTAVHGKSQGESLPAAAACENQVTAVHGKSQGGC